MPAGGGFAFPPPRPQVSKPTRAIPAHVRLQADEAQALRVRYADDRPYHTAKNRKEFVQKLASGRCKRRPRPH